MTLPRTVVEALAAITAAAKVYQRDRALRSIERRLERETIGIFAIHRAVFLRSFSRVGPGLLGEAAGPSIPQIEGALEAADLATRPDLTAAIEEAAGASVDAAARHRVAEFGVSFSFDRRNPRAEQAIREQAVRSAGEIDATTRRDLTAIVERGMREGFDYKVVAAEIAAKYDQYTERVTRPRHIRNRAELIAITESAEAYETGNRLVVDEMTAVGLEIEKSWSTVGDVRVSDGCRRNARDGWIPVDQPFSSGHQHAPRFPGCRCAVLYRRKPAPSGAM